MQSNILVASLTPTGSGAVPYNAVYNNLAVGNYDVKFYVDNVLRETKSFSVVCPAASTLYVNAANNNAGDGTDWNNAFNKLQDALTLACNCGNISEIWVAQGTYYPSVGVDANESGTIEPLEVTFQLCNNVKLYGGFSGNGTETMLTQRDVTANVTILSGDIDQNDDPFAPTVDSDNNPNTPSQTDHIKGSNAYHVVVGSGTDATALLDGFTITSGNSNGVAGGMYIDEGSPTVANCTFIGNKSSNSGAAMFCDLSEASLINCTFSQNTTNNSGGGVFIDRSDMTITNCTFSGNIANNSGGGLYINRSAPIVTNCSFSGNTANNSGGGMYNSSSSSPTVTNCHFSGNIANNGGGGMLNTSSSSPTMTNCLFSGNTANNGGGMYNSSSSTPTVTNCTFSGNLADGDGGGMRNFESDPSITNTIIWNNRDQSGTGTASASISNNNSTPTITYSLIQNITTDDVNGNKAGDPSMSNFPQFVTPVNPANAPTTAGDLRLLPGSPAINMGDDDVVTVPPFLADDMNDPIDLDGNKRIVAGMVDMGAYESPCPTITAEIAGTITICPSGNTNLTVTITGGTAPYILVYSPDGGTTEVTENDYESGTDISVMPGATTTYTLVSVTDANGCTATTLSGSATVTVEDTEAPVANCKTSYIFTLDANGMYNLQASEIDNQSSDNCGIVEYSLSKTDFTCADIGKQMVTLTVKDVVGLTDYCTVEVTVLASETCAANLVIANEDGPTIKDPCTCSMEAGFFDEEVVITGNAVGENWQLSANTGLIDPATGNPFPTGTAFTDHGSGTYSLVGRHASGVGYSIAATSEFYPETELDISNTCSYPEPVITTDLTGPFCKDYPAVRPEGNAGNATGTGSFTIDGNAATSFDPAALSVGQHEVIFTWNAGNPADETTKIGCSASTKPVMVEVIPAPTAEAGEPVEICLTKKVNLVNVGSIGGSATSGTWNTSGDGQFEGGTALGNATAYLPGPEDKKAGKVTLTLTTNTPDGNCTAASDTLQVTIRKVDCGNFPWSGQ